VKVHEDWPCIGLHALFTHESDHDEALRVCAPCTHKAECRRLVQPQRSSFSGVCAGYSWINGQAIRKGDWK
jgi:hypothetical protein